MRGHMPDADPRFARALAFVLDAEGGYAHDPVDRGGPTMCGITQGSFSAWLRVHGLPPRAVRASTAEERCAVYEEQFWRAAGCERLPEAMGLALFDAAVQHGPSTAVQLLQRALGVADDGRCGPTTVEAAMRADRTGRGRVVLRRMLFARARRYVGLWKRDPRQRRFRGWFPRLRRLRATLRLL